MIFLYIWENRESWQQSTQASYVNYSLENVLTRTDNTNCTYFFGHLAFTPLKSAPELSFLKSFFFVFCMIFYGQIYLQKAISR